MMTKDEVIAAMDLKPLPEEGGFFRETYRSTVLAPEGVLGACVGKRNLSTAIFYLVGPDDFSVLHKLRFDEFFHFYLGDPVEMVQLSETGDLKKITLGSNILDGQSLQVLAPANTWQGTRLKKGGKWALLGTTNAPGFDFQDFELGSRKQLSKQFPQYAEVIQAYSKE